MIGSTLKLPFLLLVDQFYISKWIIFTLVATHLCGRYVLPLETVPTVLRDMAVNLVSHRLYLRRPEGQLPEAIKEVYRGSLKMLEALRDGKLTLGIAGQGQAIPEPGAFHVHARPARFSGPGGLLEEFE
ncbi:hypothetical protein CBG25_10555 [Arsenophonus sp. ENCA]|nr:hypothetical protein CBG25_10555 [Arsenophonus sp. ENCA]